MTSTVAMTLEAWNEVEDLMKAGDFSSACTTLLGNYPRWRSPKEELPEADRPVLYSAKIWGVIYGPRSEVGVWGGSLRMLTDRDVLYWMPVPPTPED